MVGYERTEERIRELSDKSAEEIKNITYESLAEDNWKDRIVIRSSNNMYNQSLVASLIAKNGEKITTLDDSDRNLDERMRLIADSRGPLAVAGIMGGIDTEVSEDTTNILLESANFDFLNNRRTAQLLKLKTEACERFGKRLNADGTMTAALRAAELCVLIAGGTL